MTCVRMCRPDMQMHKQAAEQQAQQQQEDEADKAYAAMEELLGKAAAKAWKAARDASQGTAAAGTRNLPAAAALADPASVISSSSSSRTTSKKQLEVVGAAAAEPKHTDSFGRSISVSSSHSSSSGPATPTAATNNSNSTGSSAAPMPRAAAATAAAAAAGLLAAAASAANPAESLKLQLAALGVQDPANVSKALLQEVAARADLDWLLGSVAAALEARGLPRRLSKKSSMKITRELNKR